MSTPTTSVILDYKQVLINQDGRLLIHGYEYLTHNNKTFKSVQGQFTIIDNLPPLRIIINHQQLLNECIIRAITEDNDYIVISIIDYTTIHTVSYDIIKKDCLAVAYDQPEDILTLSTSGQVTPNIISTNVRWVGTYITSSSEVTPLLLIDDTFYTGDMVVIGAVKNIIQIRDNVIITNSGRSFTFTERDGRLTLIELSTCVDGCKDNDVIYLLDYEGIIHKYSQSYDFTVTRWKATQHIRTYKKLKRLINSDLVTGYGIIVESEDGDYYRLDDDYLEMLDIPDIYQPIVAI